MAGLPDRYPEASGCSTNAREARPSSRRFSPLSCPYSWLLLEVCAGRDGSRAVSDGPRRPAASLAPETASFTLHLGGRRAMTLTMLAALAGMTGFFYGAEKSKIRVIKKRKGKEKAWRASYSCVLWVLSGFCLVVVSGAFLFF